VAGAYGRDGAIVAKDNLGVLREGGELGEPRTVQTHGPQSARINEPAMLKIALMKFSFHLINMFNLLI